MALFSLNDCAPHCINALQKRHYRGFFLIPEESIGFWTHLGMMSVLMFSLRCESRSRPVFFLVPAPLCRFQAHIVVDLNSRLKSKEKRSCTVFVPCSQQLSRAAVGMLCELINCKQGTVFSFCVVNSEFFNLTCDTSACRLLFCGADQEEFFCDLE